MVEKAKNFIKHLQNNETKMVIPSVVVAELLMRIPPDLHVLFTNLLQQGFMIPPFDVKASMYFAKIWQDRKEKKIIEQLQNEHKARREELKADCMIVATAVANNASSIITYDDKLIKFAEGQIKTSEIPKIPEQQNLF